LTLFPLEIAYRSSGDAAIQAGVLRGPAWREHPMCSTTGEGCSRRRAGSAVKGVVAKKRSEPYRPGERGVKVKHRHYWRFGQELEGAQPTRRRVLI
jgi:hypothetical protein